MNKYNKIQTQDGSSTVFSPLYNENCHSNSGAVEETWLHYIEACAIQNRNGPINILEVGFGTGLGFIETTKAMADKSFVFYSLEIDPYMIETAKDIYPGIIEDKKLRLVVGDARLTLPELLKSQPDLKFHAIYQDAFSPKRNPRLWTMEWFSLLKSMSDKSCIMSTYSSSSSIRKSMLAAGWTLYEGERFGTKRSSTRAKLTGSTDKEIIEKLERSPAITLKDKNTEDYKI